MFSIPFTVHSGSAGLESAEVRKTAP